MNIYNFIPEIDQWQNIKILMQTCWYILKCYVNVKIPVIGFLWLLAYWWHLQILWCFIFYIMNFKTRFNFEVTEWNGNKILKYLITLGLKLTTELTNQQLLSWNKLIKVHKLSDKFSSIDINRYKDNSKNKVLLLYK